MFVVRALKMSTHNNRGHVEDRAQVKANVPPMFVGTREGRRNPDPRRREVIQPHPGAKFVARKIERVRRLRGAHIVDIGDGTITAIQQHGVRVVGRDHPERFIDGRLETLVQPDALEARLSSKSARAGMKDAFAAQEPIAHCAGERSVCMSASETLGSGAKGARSRR